MEYILAISIRIHLRGIFPRDHLLSPRPHPNLRPLPDSLLTMQPSVDPSAIPPCTIFEPKENDLCELIARQAFPDERRDCHPCVVVIEGLPFPLFCIRPNRQSIETVSVYTRISGVFVRIFSSLESPLHYPIDIYLDTIKIDLHRVANTEPRPLWIRERLISRELNAVPIPFFFGYTATERTLRPVPAPSDDDFKLEAIFVPDPEDLENHGALKIWQRGEGAWDEYAGICGDCDSEPFKISTYKRYGGPRSPTPHPRNRRNRGREGNNKKKKNRPVHQSR